MLLARAAETRARDVVVGDTYIYGGVILCQPQRPLAMTPRNAKGDETGSPRLLLLLYAAADYDDDDDDDPLPKSAARDLPSERGATNAIYS